MDAAVTGVSSEPDNVSSINEKQQREAWFCYRPAPLSVKKSNWPVSKVADREFVHLPLEVHEETFYLADAGGSYRSSRVSCVTNFVLTASPLLVVCLPFYQQKPSVFELSRLRLAVLILDVEL